MSDIISFDPRTISTPVYQELTKLRGQRQPTNDAEKKELKEQKAQAIELYTYLATWGLLRLKAEEKALKNEKQKVVVAFFNCLQAIWKQSNKNLTGNDGLSQLIALDVEEYLGLTGLALTVAQEFNFWANSIYHDVSGEE